MENKIVKASTDRMRAGSGHEGSKIRTMSLYRGHSNRMRSRVRMWCECPRYKLSSNHAVPRLAGSLPAHYLSVEALREMILVTKII